MGYRDYDEVIHRDNLALCEGGVLMISIEEQVRRQAEAAQAAARKMAALSSTQKTRSSAMAQALETSAPEILAANAEDVKSARRAA